MAIPLIAGLISSVGPAIVKGAKKLFQKKAAQAIGGKVADAVGGALGTKLTSALNPKEAALARGDVLSNAQQQMMDFNASEAQKNRDFQQSMFDQQTQLANTEMQRKVADYKAAGLNPAALMGGASAAGASLPSAGSGDSASAPAGAAGNLSDLFQMQKMEAEISYMKAQTSKVEAEAKGQDIDNANKPEYWNKQLALIGANREEVEANIKSLLQQVQTGAADEALKRANSRLADSKITQTDLENAILAYQIGMTKTDAKYYDAMKSLDLALKSAALDGKVEEIKNLRKTRALLQAQILTEGSKSKLFQYSGLLALSIS